jgi:hypothetical protein
MTGITKRARVSKMIDLMLSEERSELDIYKELEYTSYNTYKPDFYEAQTLLYHLYGEDKSKRLMALARDLEFIRSVEGVVKTWIKQKGLITQKIMTYQQFAEAILVEFGKKHKRAELLPEIQSLLWVTNTRNLIPFGSRLASSIPRLATMGIVITSDGWVGRKKTVTVDYANFNPNFNREEG